MSNQLDEFDNEERPSRKGLIALVVLLAGAGAAGLGYWMTAQPTVPISSGVTAPDASAPAPSAGDQNETQSKATQPASAETKPAETQVAVEAQDETVAAGQQSQQNGQDQSGVVKSANEVVAEVPAAPAVEQPKPIEQTPAAAANVVEKQPPPARVAGQAEQQVALAKPAEEPAAVQKPSAEPATAAAEPATEAPVEAPSFDTVRVEPTGDAIIAGRAKPGTEVRIKLNDAVIGTARTGEDGTFAFVTEKPLPAGAGSLTLETDQRGSVAVSKDTVAVVVKEQAQGQALVAVAKPGQPAELVQAPTSGDKSTPTNSVALDSVDYDDAGNIVFAGRAHKGATVRVYVDNKLAGGVVADEKGRWSFAGGSKVVPGKHMLRADELRADGGVASRVELPFLREDASKVASSDASGGAAAEGDAAGATSPGSDQTANAAGTSADEATRMIIQPGNSLWRLSRKVYGKGRRYTVIWEANKDQIRNPNLIYPGQVFVMPNNPQ